MLMARGKGYKKMGRRKGFRRNRKYGIKAIKKDIQKLKSQVRKNQEVIILDQNNSPSFAAPYPGIIGQYLPDSYQYTDLTVGDNGIDHDRTVLHSIPLNRCLPWDNSFSGRLKENCRNGEKVWLKKLKINLSCIAGITDEAFNNQEITKLRYFVVSTQRRALNNTTAGTETVDGMFQDVKTHLTPFRPMAGFKYRVLRQGNMSLIWNTNTGGPVEQQRMITINFGKGFKCQYYDPHEINAADPLEGKLYLVIMAQKISPVPQAIGQTIARYKFSSRIYCNE